MRMSPIVSLIFELVISRTIWEGLEGVALFILKVCHWWALRFQKPKALPINTLCFVPVNQDVSLQLLLQHRASLPASMIAMDFNPLKL